MIVIPPMLYSLVMDNRLPPSSVKIYRMFKMYAFNNKKQDLGTILSDLEMDELEFRRVMKQLIEYGFIERTKIPGKKSEYSVLNGNLESGK